MADIQVRSFLQSTRDPSKNKITFFLTAKNCSQRRPVQVSDTTSKLVSISRLLKRLLNPTTLTRNVPSLQE